MKRTLSALALVAATTLAAAQSQGVGKAEILLGTIQDLSGPSRAMARRRAWACSCASTRSTNRVASTAAS